MDSTTLGRPEDLSSPATRFEDAPEVVVPDGLFPHAPEKIPVPGQYLAYSLSDESSDEKDYPPGKHPASKLWYKRRRIWIPGLIALVVVLAVGLGVGIGIAANSTSSLRSPSNKNVTQAVVCNGTICPQILSSATMNGASYLFAVGQDRSMWYATSNGSDWTDNWANLGGQFVSQPSSLVWNSSRQLDVFGISSSGAAIHRTLLASGAWSQWESLGENSVSAVVPCRMQYGADRADIWIHAQDSTNTGIAHDYCDSKDNMWFGEKNLWDTSVMDSPISVVKMRTNSTPAIACRDNDRAHDAIIYEQDTQAVLHRQYSNSSGAWLDWVNQGGTFAGNPVLVTTSNDRIDFFGIGSSDKAMYHFKWTLSTGYSKLENLGGTWASVPSVVASSNGRLDVVALDSSATLKHRALIGSTWAADWDNMNITAASAPLAVSLNSSLSHIGVFVLDSSHAVLHATYEANDGGGWKQVRNFKSINGNLTISGL